MRWPENIEFEIEYKVYDEISKFYHNVGYKYINTYGREEINKLIENKFAPLLHVSKNKLLSDPFLDRWKGYGRIVIDKWNFAIDIKGDKAIIVDACHAQNMHNNKTLIELFEKDLQGYSDKVKNLTLPHTPGNPYFMRVELNDCCFYMKKITEENYFKCKDDSKFAYKLAEELFVDEIQYIEQSQELLDSRGFKL